jgi:peptidoglycan/xylan/chitin deacetylase (PgdA/CDA1 family)
MSLKHQLKTTLRGAYARLLFHTGLHAVVNRLMPPRLTILAGHCVGEPGNGAPLPADMYTSPRKLARFLDWFGQRYELCTVGAGLRAIRGGSAKKSLVALSFDDGYRDNHRVLLPLLAQRGAGATVFLESRPLDNRRVNWSHKYFWILGRMPLERFVRRYRELSSDAALCAAMEAALREEPARGSSPQRAGRANYMVKRKLKYDAVVADRELVLDQIFTELGGDEQALCDELYMTWDEARELAAAGVELGGHTVTHPILSRLPRAEAEREVGEGAAALRRVLGDAVVTTFAYPWGRRWDFDADSQRAVRLAGFDAAVTMHPGVNLAGGDPYTCARVAIDDGAELHLLVAEACGGFELLRRVGVNLSE